MVARYRPAVPGVLLLYAEGNGPAVCGIQQDGLARIRRVLVSLAACLGLHRFWQRFQAGPHNFLVSLVYRHCRFGLRAQLLHRGGQGCVLSAYIYFDRDCRWIWHPLVDPTRRSIIAGITLSRTITLKISLARSSLTASYLRSTGRWRRRCYMRRK